jgi:hypothetical protein
VRRAPAAANTFAPGAIYTKAVAFTKCMRGGS